MGEATILARRTSVARSNYRKRLYDSLNRGIAREIYSAAGLLIVVKTAC